MKKPITILIIACVAIVALIGFGLWRFIFAEQWHYAAADRDISRLMQNIQKQYPNSTITTNNYCSYSHQKYSKTLGCNVEQSISLEKTESSLKYLLEEKSPPKWVFKFDNTSGLKEFSVENYVKHEVYNAGDLKCSIGLKDNNQKYEYTVSCYSNARLAWYPVKGE